MSGPIGFMGAGMASYSTPGPMGLSVVIPVYNESVALPRLHERLTAVLASPAVSACGLGEWELVFVDDGSADASYAVLEGLAAKDPAVRAVRFARNFGKEAAMAAGLRLARGRVVVLMDGDLQHPPEVIPDLLAAWRDGARMVTAVRRVRQEESLLRRAWSKSFYWLFRVACEVPIPEGAGDFRLFDRAVVDAINSLPERNRFMKGITSWVGFRQAFVPFDPAPREGGRSGWSFWRLFRYAFDGLSAFSTLPLRVWSLIGMALAGLSGVYGLWLVLRTLLWGADVPGYASLMVATLFLSGVQLVSLGVLGEYVGRVFTEVKGRPLYLIADWAGFPPPAGDATRPAPEAAEAPL